MTRPALLRALWLFGFLSNWAFADHHEIVFPRMLASRADTNEKMLEVTAFGKNMNLRLKPSPVLGPNLMMRTDDGHHWVYTKEKLDELNSRLFLDPEQQASLYIDDTNGPLHVEGMLNEQLRIEPVPTLMARSGETPHRVSLTTREDYESEVSAVREVYTRSPFHNDQRFPPVNISVDQIVDYDPAEEEETRQIIRRRFNQVQRDMLVELLIIADKAHTAGFGSENEHIRYLAVGANGMNLRLASVPNPKTKVVITGILRNTNDQSEPYVARNTHQQKYLMDAQCLDDIGPHIERNHGTLKYDVAILYTGKDLADMDTGKLETNVAGIAWVGAACVKNYRFGLAEDTPKTFNGIRAITHEIAHLLGAPHDGDPTPGTMPGSSGSKMCPWKDGYIMSYVRAGERSHRFSSCSSNQFAFYQLMTKGACLRKTDGQVVASNGDLPAKMYSQQEICARTHSEESGVQFSEDAGRLAKCQILCCIPRVGRCSVQDCVDGTPCGSGRQCRAGKCE